MVPAHLRPLVRAFRDFQSGAQDATVVLWRDDGLAEALAVEYFFRTPENFSPLEQTALDLCRGRVLDTAAFAGSHSLALQDRGRRVCGLSWGVEGVGVLEARGVVDCRSSLDDLDERFDTVLRLNPGIGLAETFDELDRFLQLSRLLTDGGGQVLLHSRDITQAGSPLQYVYAMLNRSAGRFPGEVRLQIEYANERGPWFQWMHIDAPTLAARARLAGWKCEVVGEDNYGSYLARLVA